MRKKAIGYAFLVRLLIAIIAIVTVVIIATTLGKGLFKKTAAAAESFEDFAARIEEIKQEDEDYLKRLRVDMDEDDAIWFFSKGFPDIKITGDDYQTHISFGQDFTDIQLNRENYPTYVKRPDVSGCSERESCLCLCREYSIKDVEEVYAELTCDDLHKCEKAANITFKTPATEDLKYVGGLVIESDSSAMKLIFVEKGPGNSIGICEERISSCLE